MYEAFYGLKEKPFSMLPDPGFLYLSKKHQTALVLLEYGVLNHVGFCVISGAPGAGKTTVLRALLKRVADDVKVGLITNTHQSFGDLMDWVLSAFDLHQPNLTHVEMHQIFMDYLIEEYANNRSVLLIVDEAQNMSPDALEELRMLSNVNSGKDQLMQVVLAGQPALRDALRKPEMMQFAQRIAVDYHIEALNHEETCGYIQHRLVTAGAVKDVFTPAACARIFSYSGGTPRLINLLCETVLVYGFADQRELIDVDLVDELVLERMKDSLVPIVNRDIAQQSINKIDAAEQVKDFPWIKPEGESQGIKPDYDILFNGDSELEQQKKQDVSAVKQPAATVIVNKGVAEASSTVAAANATAQKASDKKPASVDELVSADKAKAVYKAEPPVTKQNTAIPVLDDSEAVPPFPAASENNDVSGHKAVKYGAVLAIIIFLVILLFSPGLGEKIKSDIANYSTEKDVQDVQEQREEEEARVLQLQIAAEAEALKKESEAAIAKAEEEARAKEQAERLAAEKAAIALKAAAAAAAAAEEKRRLEKDKRIAAEKKRQRLAKQQEAEAKAQEEIERLQREAAQLEDERLAMEARLEKEVRLQQELEARRLELEWQEKLRQEVLEAEKKAEAAAAEAVAVEEAAKKAKNKSVECSGPTARFKAVCR